MMDLANDGNWLKRIALAVVMTGALALAPTASAAADVEEITTESGVRAYLIHEPAVPFLSMSFRFKGGSIHDPRGMEGLAYMVSGIIDEGAGDLDSEAFRRELEDNAIRLNFDADRDAFSGTLKSLSETREHAFELLRLALSEPRFDEEPVERIRSQIAVSQKRRESDPDYIASRAWFEHAFEGHPYGRPTRGTAESIAAVTVEAMRDYVAKAFARGNLVIGVAGDITAAELEPLLERTFGSLPAEPGLAAVPSIAPKTGALLIDRQAVPQSVVTFGHGGIARDDPDYYTGYVVNYILGGGGFSSRLTEEVRERRGLAYSVYAYLYDTDLAPIWIGGVATANDRVAQSIAIIRAELQKIASDGITAEELANAKTYLTGSFALRLTSNDEVSRMLAGMLAHDLGRDFLDRRNGYIEAVTLEDAQRVARRLFDQDLLVSVAGDPAGLEG